MVDFGEAPCSGGECKDLKITVKKLIDLTLEIDEMYRLLWMNEAKVGALVQRDEIYRSALESGRDEYCCAIGRRELLRDRLRLADDCEKPDLLKRIAVLSVDVDLFEDWSDRVGEARERVADEVNVLKDASGELLKLLPSRLEARGICFSQLSRFSR
jgi:hypothetical protein